MGLLIVVTATIYYSLRTRLMGRDNICAKCDRAYGSHIYGACPPDYEPVKTRGKFSGI